MNEYRAMLAAMITKRDALTRAIDALSVVVGEPEPLEVAVPRARASKPRTGKPRLVKPSTPTLAASVARASSGSTSARDEAILSALRRNGGMATTKELKAAMPKEPALTDDARLDAYNNAITRLKTKGLIGRTGDTWSLVA